MSQQKRRPTVRTCSCISVHSRIEAGANVFERMAEAGILLALWIGTVSSLPAPQVSLAATGQAHRAKTPITLPPPGSHLSLRGGAVGKKPKPPADYVPRVEAQSSRMAYGTSMRRAVHTMCLGLQLCVCVCVCVALWRGGRWGAWRYFWRSLLGEGGISRPSKMLANVLVLALVLLLLHRFRRPSGIATPLPWTEEVSKHLQGLAAEWDIPTGSTYAQKLLSSESVPNLIANIQCVLGACEQAQRRRFYRSADSDRDQLIAAAVGCAVLSDLSCRLLLPRIIQLRSDHDFWSKTLSKPAWRLSLETLSLPLGPTLASRVPSRSLERRLHECKVLQLGADVALGSAAEAVGRLHEELALLRRANDTHALFHAVVRNTDTLVSISRRVRGPLPPADDAPRGAKKDIRIAWYESFRRRHTKEHVEVSSARTVLLRLAHCAELHADLLDKVTGGFKPGYGRPNWLQRSWPEVLVMLGVWLYAPAMVRRSYTVLKQAGVEALEGARTLFRENLKGPLTQIKKALLDKPESPQLDGAAAASKESLYRMIESFNLDIYRRKEGGMSAVTRQYEQEIKAPLTGALNGRLFRAFLIQVQEMKVNFETEIATIQKILEAQQLNLQIVAMFPALGVVAFLSRLVPRVYRWISADPLRPQLDLEALLHKLSRQVLLERTSPVGSKAASRARGVRCLLAWEAGELLKRSRVSAVSDQLRKDVARLSTPETPPEHLALLLDLVFRQLFNKYK